MVLLLLQDQNEERRRTCHLTVTDFKAKAEPEAEAWSVRLPLTEEKFPLCLRKYSSCLGQWRHFPEHVLWC